MSGDIGTTSLEAVPIVALGGRRFNSACGEGKFATIAPESRISLCAGAEAGRFEVPKLQLGDFFNLCGV